MTQTAPNAPLSGWTIEYQQPATELDSTGRAVQGMRVGFRTGKGVVSYVFLSNAQYSVDNVRAAVAAKAKQIDDVHSLTG